MLVGYAKQALPALHQLAESSFRLATSSVVVRDYCYSPQLAITNKANRAGPGGRSSVNGITATIFGANGFVGSYVANEVARKGAQVVCPHRCVETKALHLRQMGDLGQMILLPEFDIRDEDAVKHAISRSNVVINMIGQRIETMNFSFDDVHVDWPKRLAKIVAQSPQVEHFIHFSELGADENHASRRLKSKAVGDKHVMDAVPEATIIRPASIVGIEDHFYNYLIYQLGVGLLAPVIDGGAARIQPTWVRDVADATVALLSRQDTRGKTIYLGGPEVLTIRDLYDTLIKTLRLHTDDTVHVPAWAARALYKTRDAMRKFTPPLPTDSWMESADYVEEVIRDRVVPAGAMAYADLDIKASKVTDGLAIEPVRHFRVGGYRWGDMATVAKDVPENIRKYYNIK